MSKPSLKDLLAVAMDAAYLGGRRALSYYKTGIEVETKADQSPVTRADRESEELIRGCIAKHYPKHSIVGEELGSQVGQAAYRWIVDPIDGTKSFIHGVPLWGVLIGVEVEDQASVGVIYLAAQDEMLAAATGLGCHANGRECHVSKVQNLSEATLLASDVYMCQERSDAYDRLAKKAKLTRTWGDAYGYALVATGRAELMLDPVMNPWDCAPMLPILREAGGHFTDWNGVPTIWGKDSFACNAALFDEVAAVLKHEKRRK
ncbi:MAG: inositol monophosphatase family protein [Acidobacteria bacterium]|nr:inositol monophosphatase family protein [Acidobacteriota bacterium]MBI3830990.1 inositol monophosphatase family protein [Planctomycetota bacterium]